MICSIGSFLQQYQIIAGLLLLVGIISLVLLFIKNYRRIGIISLISSLLLLITNVALIQYYIYSGKCGVIIN